MHAFKETLVTESDIVHLLHQDTTGYIFSSAFLP